jgi:hypothetical protein
MTTITIERGLVLKLYIYWLRDVDPAGLEAFRDKLRAVLGVPVTALEQLDPADLCDVCGEPVRYGSRHHACGDSVLRANATSPPATAPDEIEQLRAESEERLQNCAALIAENERLRKDAERYRWLRDEWIDYKPAGYDGRNVGRFDLVLDHLTCDLDAAIDAAMKGEKP